MTAPRVDDPAADREVEQRWRAHSIELPRPQVDDAIRAAARRAVKRRPVWQRYAPLAAAASVGVIALLLARQTPTPTPTRPEQRAPVMPAPVAAAPAPAPVEPAPVAPAPVVPAPVTPANEAERVAKRAAPEPRAATAPMESAVRSESESDVAAADATAAPSPAPMREHAAVAARAEKQANQTTNGFPPHLAELVRADAARRTGAQVDQATIVSAEAITWSDGALGCRTPGEMAIQALTPGYRVEVDVAGRRLFYHTDTRTQIRVCERLSPPR